MNYDNFLSFYKSRYRINSTFLLRESVCKKYRFKNMRDYDDPAYNKLISLKLLTKHIDFMCEFDKVGACYYYSNKYRSCCCYNCAESVGYLVIIPINQLKYYARLFNSKTGFFREKRGCILPREKRSNLCLTHACGLDNKKRKSLEGLRHIRRLMDDVQGHLIQKYNLPLDEFREMIKKGKF